MTNNYDYSVRVKNGADWRKFARVRLMISTGQPYHEGSKFLAVTAWINRNPHIKKVHVSVNDLLQRHNLLAAGMTEKQAASIFLAEGTLWTLRNDVFLSKIKAEILVTRWQDWFGRPVFQTVRQALLDYARTDDAFAEAIEKDARALVERKYHRGEIVENAEALVAHSRNYVTEELAVFAMQTRELPAAEIYPGSNLCSAHYLLGKKLPEPISPLSERYFTRIDFARVHADGKVGSSTLR